MTSAVRGGYRRSILKIETPTLFLIISVYGGLAALTWFFGAIPLWIALPVGAYLVALHSSLQHEALHGHPTRNSGINEVLVSLPVGIFIPYRRYKATHLQHHCDERLTDPYDDPESFYFSQHAWTRTPRVVKRLFEVNNTLLGRLILGPLLSVTLFLLAEFRIARQSPGTTARAWVPHIIGLAAVFIWVVWVCAIPAWLYVLGFAYPGMSLILLRSFAEHQARQSPAQRTVVVEASPLFALLYLNNNLHFAHHKYPGLPWYRLPEIYRREAEQILEDNAGYRFAGYGEIMRRYGLRAKESVSHPHV